MTSDQQIAANRNNAKRSTGPRSKAGREMSRRNALRHGLAISAGNAPAMHDDIEKLARVLSHSDGAKGVCENARVAAEAHLDLLRIRNLRACLFERHYFVVGPAPDNLRKLNNELAKLERYERRAFSKRKRGLRALR